MVAVPDSCTDVESTSFLATQLCPNMSEPPNFPALTPEQRNALATFVAKRFRKYHASSTD